MVWVCFTTTTLRCIQYSNQNLSKSVSADRKLYSNLLHGLEKNNHVGLGGELVIELILSRLSPALPTFSSTLYLASWGVRYQVMARYQAIRHPQDKLVWLFLVLSPSLDLRFLLLDKSITTYPSAFQHLGNCCRFLFYHSHLLDSFFLYSCKF